MKVLMVARGLDYGFGGHTRPLIRELTAEGIDVRTYYAGSDTKTALGPLIRPKAFKAVDVVHYQGTPYNVLGCGKPTVVTAHTLLSRELEYEKRASYYVGLLLESMAVRRATAIISVNPVLTEELLSEGIETPIFDIPNGVDTERFDREDYQREDFILAGGRLVKRKGFLTLVDALDSHSLPHVKLFGEGPLKRRLYWTMRVMDKQLGYVSEEELVRLYLTAGLFVCPSFYESGPLTVLEAMAAHCPVVCAGIPEVAGVVEDEVTGLLFTPGDPDNLRETLWKMSTNMRLAKTLAENAYAFVKRERQWNDLARKTIRVYEEVV